MVDFGIGFLALAAMASFIDWRLGVYLVAVVGVFQDAFRKVVPGEPVQVQLAVVVVFLATVAGMYKRYGSLRISGLVAAFPAMRRPLTFIFWYLVLQHAVTVVRYQRVPFLAIGAITYFAPLLAVVVGFTFARAGKNSTGAVTRYLLLYTTLAVAAASGILFDFFGYKSPLLDPVGQGLFIFGESGRMKLYQGLFRASEIAAWHIGTAICLLLALATAPGRNVRRAITVMLVPPLLAGAFLTGRRKVLMVILIFLAFYFFIQFTLRQAKRSYYPIALLLIGLGAGLYVGDFFDLSSPRERMSSYLQRGGTVLEASPERFNLLGVQSVYWAVRGHGLWGVGAGVLGQGSQYYGSGSGAAEGGLGKITAELGVPGLLLFGWLAVVAVREAARLFRQLNPRNPGEREIVAGLTAVLAANVPNFIVASQAYGDPMIILSLGLFTGFAAGIGAPATGTRTLGDPQPARVRASSGSARA